MQPRRHQQSRPRGVELIQGTPAGIDDLRKAAQSTEAVISVLNNARASDNLWAKPITPPHFMTDAARDTLTGEQGIRRTLLTSAQGGGRGPSQLRRSLS